MKEGVLSGLFTASYQNGDQYYDVGPLCHIPETASEQSDVEGRIRALNDDLQRRKREAERLKKEQRKEEKKQEHNKLKEQEQALKEQIEVDFLFHCPK